MLYLQNVQWLHYINSNNIFKIVRERQQVTSAHKLSFTESEGWALYLCTTIRLNVKEDETKK